MQMIYTTLYRFVNPSKLVFTYYTIYIKSPQGMPTKHHPGRNHPQNMINSYPVVRVLYSNIFALKFWVRGAPCSFASTPNNLTARSDCLLLLYYYIRVVWVYRTMRASWCNSAIKWMFGHWPTASLNSVFEYRLYPIPETIFYTIGIL